MFEYIEGVEQILHRFYHAPIVPHDDFWKYDNFQYTFSSYFPYIEDPEQILHKYYYTPVAPRNALWKYEFSSLIGSYQIYVYIYTCLLCVGLSFCVRGSFW